tara:strand:+ start:201 stop:2336 length:2136 start_codon:yes stop_codon:yes gene_type:complete
MADLKAKQIKFPLTGTDIVSSSAQIASDISGSFNETSASFATTSSLLMSASGSFSTRVTTAESELGNTLVSSSAQIATDISGSFVADSGSFSTRVTTEEGNVDTLQGRTLTAGDGLTGGGTLASDRSFAVGAGTGVTVNADDVAIGQAVATTSKPLFAAISASGDISASSSGSFQNILVEDNITATNLLGTLRTATQGVIDHDSLSGFVANEHVDHSGVTITAGAGLTGGGTIASTRTLAVGAGTGVTVNANDVAIGQAVATTSNVKFNHITGSGNISGSQGNILGFKSGSFQQLDANVVSASSIQATSLTGLVGTATQGTINHDSLSGFVANEHVDHSGVTITAGDGLTGGGTIASTRTLAVGAGTGVTVNANDVAIGQSVATNANVTFASINTTGNIEAQGDVIAQNYIVSSSVTFMTSSFRSGSTISGDTPADDTHQFTGSLSISGSAPTDITTTNSIFVGGNITGSIISGSSLLGVVGTATQATIDHDGLANFVADEHVAHGDVSVIAGAGLTGGGTIAANRTINVVGGTGVTANANDVAIGQDVATTANVKFNHITGSGNISGSLGNILGFNSGSFDYISVTGNVTASAIETSGDIVAFGSSDRELKDNIQPIENPLEKMDKIGGYTFDWNDKQSTYKGKDVGVVAQEIQSVLPEIVAGRANGYLGVKYEKIVPLLIESIKENTKKIKELEEEINQINKNCDCLNK